GWGLRLGLARLAADDRCDRAFLVAQKLAEPRQQAQAFAHRHSRPALLRRGCLGNGLRDLICREVRQRADNLLRGRVMDRELGAWLRWSDLGLGNGIHGGLRIFYAGRSTRLKGNLHHGDTEARRKAKAYRGFARINADGYGLTGSSGLRLTQSKVSRR